MSEGSSACSHIIKTMNNGVKCAFLPNNGGLSAIGAVFSMGSKDAKDNGQMFLSMQAKLLDAIGSPQNAFKNGISTTLDVQKEHSTILFEFMPESEKMARIFLDNFFSVAPPTPNSINFARNILSSQEILGNIPPSKMFESVACASSCDDKTYSIDTFNNNPAALVIIPSLQTKLLSNSVFFGSLDQESSVSSFASAQRVVMEKKDYRPPKFVSGLLQKPASGLKFSGTKLLKSPDLPKVSISFPAPSLAQSEFNAMKIISKIFGGGSSFSSEGLGTGLNSLCYKHLLSKSPECEEVRTNYRVYSSFGLLSFDITAPSSELEFLSGNLKKCCDSIGEIDESAIKAAKEQTIVEYLKSIDNSTSLFLDFASSIALSGKWNDPMSTIKNIREVTRNSVIEVAKSSFSNKPSVGILGNADPSIVFQKWK